MPQTEKKVHVTLSKEIFGKEYEEWIPFGEESHPMRHVEKKLISTFLLMQIVRGRVTRRSHTGIIIFLNIAPIIWFSNK